MLLWMGSKRKRHDAPCHRALAHLVGTRVAAAESADPAPLAPHSPRAPPHRFPLDQADRSARAFAAEVRSKSCGLRTAPEVAKTRRLVPAHPCTWAARRLCRDGSKLIAPATKVASIRPLGLMAAASLAALSSALPQQKLSGVCTCREAYGQALLPQPRAHGCGERPMSRLCGGIGATAALKGWSSSLQRLAGSGT
jgi:hypothetical protein